MKTATEGRRARRRFTSEFKSGAARLVLDEGKSIGAVARELDLTPSALGSWVARMQADRTKGRTGLTSEERAELARLRKENRDLCSGPASFGGKGMSRWPFLLKHLSYSPAPIP